MDEWNASDAAALNEFLSRPIGEKFMRALRNSSASLRPARTIEEQALNAREAMGASTLFDSIQMLRTFQPTTGKQPFIDTRTKS